MNNQENYYYNLWLNDFETWGCWKYFTDIRYGI